MVIDNNIVNVQTVAAVLNGPSDIGCLCGDKEYASGSFIDKTRINPYSFNKPVRLNSYSKITNTQREAINYGWVLPQYSSTYALNTMIRDKAEGLIWTYNKPRGLSTYNELFRIDDFRGYNDDEEFPPFNFTLSQTQITQDSKVNLFIKDKELLNTNNQGIWRWGWGSGKNMLEMGLGVFISTTSSVAAENPNLVWCLLNGYNVGKDMSDIGTEDDKYDVFIPAAYMQAFCHDVGTYYITPFLTSHYNADSGTNSTTQQVVGTNIICWPFYGPQLVLEVVTSTVPNPLDSVVVDYVSIVGTKDSITGYVTINSITISIYNGTATNMTMDVTLEVTPGEGGYPNLSSFKTLTVNTLSTINSTFTYATNNIVYNPEKGKIKVSLSSNGFVRNSQDLGVSIDDLIS